MTTEDDELNARVEAELDAALEADLQAEKAKRRAEIAFRLRREETKKWHDRVSARHPCEGPLAGLTREQHEARLKSMSAAAAKSNREMDEANSRVVDGDLRAQRAAAKGGAAGFRFK
jgi:hypothetical protein